MAAISKVIRRSHKLRGATPSISTLCLDFVGRRFQKRIAEYIMPSYPPFWRPFKNMTAISKVIRRSQKLSGAEPLISTICVCFVGHILAEKVLCRMCQY